MEVQSYYYNCSPEYIKQISDELQGQVLRLIARLPRRQVQSELNSDVWWLFTSRGWSYDSIPSSVGKTGSPELHVQSDRNKAKRQNIRDLCLTSTTMGTQWRSDFANTFEGKLVQVEAQFGKLDAMFKDFCGFKIAYAEKRLALGIEIVLSDPMRYFEHPRRSVSEMANFDMAKNTLTTIGMDVPIWLIGIDA